MDSTPAELGVQVEDDLYHELQGYIDHNDSMSTAFAEHQAYDLAYPENQFEGSYDGHQMYANTNLSAIAVPGCSFRAGHQGVGLHGGMSLGNAEDNVGSGYNSSFSYVFEGLNGHFPCNNRRNQVVESFQIHKKSNIALDPGRGEGYESYFQQPNLTVNLGQESLYRSTRVEGVENISNFENQRLFVNRQHDNRYEADKDSYQMNGINCSTRGVAGYSHAFCHNSTMVDREQHFGCSTNISGSVAGTLNGYLSLNNSISIPPQVQALPDAGPPPVALQHAEQLSSYTQVVSSAVSMIPEGQNVDNRQCNHMEDTHEPHLPIPNPLYQWKPLPQSTRFPFGDNNERSDRRRPGRPSKVGVAGGGELRPDILQAQKRPRGRPKKVRSLEDELTYVADLKRGPGRPRKVRVVANDENLPVPGSSSTVAHENVDRDGAHVPQRGRGRPRKVNVLGYQQQTENVVTSATKTAPSSNHKSQCEQNLQRCPDRPQTQGRHASKRTPKVTKRSRREANDAHNSMQCSIMLQQGNQAATNSENYPFYRHHDPVRLNSIKVHDLGVMNYKCTACGALYFRGEKPVDKNGSYNWCCKNGRVDLQFGTFPPELREYFPEDIRDPGYPYPDPPSADRINFMEYIRKYNSAFAFASFSHQTVTHSGRGTYCFNIDGSVYHAISDVLPKSNSKEAYMQAYWLDPDAALKLRFENPINEGVFHHVMEEIEKTLRKVNPFAKSLSMLKDVAQRGNIVNGQREDLEQLSLCMLHEKDEQKRRDFRGSRNVITANEVAVVYKNYGDENTPAIPHRAIHLRSGALKSVSSLDPYLDAYTYPLFFPLGEMGWSPTGIKYKGSRVNRRPRKKKPGSKERKEREYVTCQEYVRYLCQERDSPFCPVLLGGKLTDQYICDSFLRIEYQRLFYLQSNQPKLRRESYLGLHDFLSREAALRGYTTGQVSVLPSSFTSGPRYMYQLYADAMAMVRELGMPDYFITMTCNPKWVEILRRLRPGMTPDQRKDIAVRVFEQKLSELLVDLTQRNQLGRVKGWCYTIEYQKRGLPHVHMLFIMHDQDKPRTPEQVQRAVSAELPDRSQHPDLYAKVREFMIHTPCNSVEGGKCCIKDERSGDYKCTKKFPKPFESTTNVDVNGFAQVRRRDNRGMCEPWKGVAIDNSWVVPYNPELLLKYNCHINIEVVSSVRAIKYLFKYVYKGEDKVSLCVKGDTLNHNEIESYKDSRYLCPSEGFWRVFKFVTNDRSHTIERLPVHEPLGQSVYFREGHEDKALKRAQEKGTMLTKYFELNKDDPDAKNYYYHEIPKYYTWDQDLFKWEKRVRYAADKTIGRVYSTKPSDVERDSIRRLLLNRKGCESFKELFTVDGKVHSSAKQALIALGLAEGSGYWRAVLEEARLAQFPKALRELFVTMCAVDDKSCASEMWDEFRTSLIEDFVHKGDTEEVAVQRALEHMQEELLEVGITLDQLGLSAQLNSQVVRTQRTSVGDKVTEMVRKLNQEQRVAVLAVLNAVTRITGTQFSEFFSPPPSSLRPCLHHFQGVPSSS